MAEYVIEGRINKKVWKQNSLRFDVMLQVAGADIQIQDLDIDFDVIKTDNAEANKSTITIWNLNDTTYQRLIETAYAVDLYTRYGDDEFALMFRGYIERDKAVKKNSTRAFLASPIKQDAEGVDIPTIIELTDGKIAYRDSKINKNYREKVSSTQIIKDCIEAMGVGISKFSEELPATEYNTFKAVGKPHVILGQICKPLNIKFSIQNDLIQVIAPGEEFDGEYAVLLNPSNSMRPERQGENEINITTRLIPSLNPDDWVQCEFKEFEGVERVRQIRQTGNNYGTAGASQITIGFDKLKAPKRRKKRERAEGESL